MAPLVRYCSAAGCDLHTPPTSAHDGGVGRCGVCHRSGVPLRWVPEWQSDACHRCVTAAKVIR